MPRLLVTGGCGFIGSNFIRHLLTTDPTISITNLDKLTYAGNPENLADLTDPQSATATRYDFVHGDIVDRAVVDSVMTPGRFDAVIHFAAESHVDRSILDSGPFIQTNIVGTQVLLDASRRASIARYVQVSTDEVYGSLGATGLFTEETPLAPNSPYSASKAAADMLLRSYVHTFDFPGIITRCSNNYGPYQFPEKVLPLFVSNALGDLPLPLYGAGQNIRDWIHVLDHCRGIEAAWRRGKSGEIYNFGGGCELTNLELTHRLLDALGKPRSLIQFVTDRPGHDLRYAIDDSKARRDLGWSPQISFDAGLRETIAWYQTHGEWVARIKSGAYRNYYAEQYGTRLAPAAS